MHDPAYKSFATRVNAYLADSPARDPYSHEEVFAELLQRGLEARRTGNYGIAAAYRVRSGGVELTAYGQNRMVSLGDPHAHAEMQAVQEAVKLLQTPASKLKSYFNAQQASGGLKLRAAPTKKTETILYTTLEPCPMCTVGCVVNTGVTRVVIAHADPLAGQLNHNSETGLSPLWDETLKSHGTEVEYASTLSPTLSDLLYSLFYDERSHLDEYLKERSLLDNSKLAAIAKRHL